MNNSEPKSLINLLIGGKTDKPGWTTLNADPSTNPDIVSDIRTLEGVASGSALTVYASHVFEHIELKDTLPTLKRINEIMAPNGKLYLAVPDLTVLMQLLHDQRLDINQKIHVVRMIFGGQISSYDFHYFGYTFELLAAFLASCGFDRIRKVDSFDLHQDTSDFAPYFKKRISLNVTCQKKS